MRDEEKTREQLLTENATLRAKFSELKKVESESRWVKAALRESEERYKRLLESVTDYIYTVKIENDRPVSTSHGLGCIAVTGYTSEQYQMYPNLWYEMIHEEDRKAVLDQAEKLLKGEAAEPLEHRIIHKDGSIRWVRNTPVPHYDKDGNLDSYDGIIVDITERKRAEELLVSTFERITDAFVALDTEWRYTYVNKKAGQIFGRRAEDLIGKHIWTEFPEGIDQPFYRAYYKAVAEQIPIQIEDYYPPYDRWFENRIYPSKDGLTIYFQDITERKRAEEVLRRSENMLRLFVEYTPAAVAMFDLDMKYIAASRRYLADYRLGEQEIVGRSHYDVFPEMPERWKEIHQRCLAGAVEKCDQDPFPRADGRLDWVRWEIRPWHESSGEIGGIILFSEVITEGVQAEEALRESEARIRSIFEQASDGIFLITAENRYLDVNARGLEMLGYTREELLQMTVADVVVARERPRLAVEPAEMLAGKPHMAEWEHLRKDGSTFPAEVSARRLDEKTYIAIVRDQTERKNAEEALRKSKDLLQSIVENAPIRVFWKDRDSRFLGCNTRFAKDAGRSSPDELTGKTDFDMVWKDQAELYRAADKAVMESGSPKLGFEEPQTTPDGNTIWLRTSKVPLRDESNQIIGILGIYEDITERKNAEDALRESEEKLQKIINGSSAVIFVKDLNGKYLLINSLYEKLFYVSKNEIIGKTDYDIFPKEVADAMRAVDKKALMANEPVEAEEVVPQDDGLHYYISSKFPLYDVQGKPYAVCGIATDITGRKKAEEALRERERLLSETGRMAHVGGWEFDTETLKGTWTEEVARIHEMDPEAQTTAPLGLSFYHGESRRKIELAVKDAIEQGKPYDLELELVTAKGNHRWVRTNGQPVKEGNKVVKVRGSFQDITESKKAEERIKQEMEITSHLLMISEATSGMTDIDKLMEQVVHCSHEIVKCDICLSYLWDDETGVLSPSQEFGLSHNLIPLLKTESLDMKTGFIKEAMKKREPVIKEVGAVHELPLQWIEYINTIAVIPLIGRKGPLGMIVGIYQVGAGLKPAPTIEEREMKIMKGISHQVSIALEEARLFKESVDRAMELSHRIETIKAMHEIDRSILSALEPKEILETSTRLVAKVIPCDMATVVNVGKERQAFSWGAGFGTPFLEGLGSAPLEETSAGEVVKTGRTEYVANLLDIKEPLPIEKGLIKEGFLSHIRVPIMAKGEVSGILAIGAKRPSAFTPKNLSTLEYLGAQIGVALENARLITDLRELFLGIVKTLSSTIDAKSPWTAGHSERVTRYALDIGKEMRLSEEEIKNLELAGLLHDLGKIGTYEYILDKPDRLTDEEIKIMRQHPGKGANILSPIKQLMPIIPAIKYHHEFYDGTGYPDGLLSTAIPLFARILTVADTVDAMGADRPYRKGRAMDVIVAELKRCSGTQFDPKVVEAFLKLTT